MVLPITNGLVFHLESDSGVTTSGGNVTGWNDASGSGFDLVASGDPKLIAGATQSGAPAISFDGVGDRLERLAGLDGLPSGSADRTIFFVVNYVGNGGVSAGLSYGDADTNQTFGLVSDWSGGDLAVQGYGAANDFDSGVDAASQGWIVQSVVVDADTYTQYLNGTAIDSGNHVFDTDLQRLIIGGEIGDRGEASLAVSAALIYDRALSETERGDVENYLQSKYIAGGGNVTPVTADDSANVLLGESVDIDVLSNDFDDTPLDGSMINIVNGPAHGTITNINPVTGVVTYEHGGSLNDDSFTYTVTDSGGATSQETTVNIAAAAQELPLDSFSNELVLDRAGMTNAESGFFLPISMAFLPDNRMLLLSKDGEILIVDPETGAHDSYMVLNNIDAGQERGLLDITLDPDFANNGYFYLYYTPNNPENARIARFQHQENGGGLSATGDLASETVIWEDSDGYLACCHYGGGLDFGPDGKIWLTTSDKFQASTPGEGPSGGNDIPLDLTSSSGKIIRVNADGTIPDGTDGWIANPYIDGPGGNDDSVWAYGLRNPFRAEWDFEYGYLYVAEVGGNRQNLAHDDLHLVSLDQRGAFYGWPFYEGTPNVYVNDNQSPEDPANFPAADTDLADEAAGDFYSNPIWSIDHQGNSTSLTGGEVYRGDMFPSEWDGVYFYGDYTNDFIRYLRLDASGTQILGDFAFKPSVDIPGNTEEIVSISVGEDGALYYLLISSGEVHRIVYDGNQAPDINSSNLAPLVGDLPLQVTFTANVTDADGDPLTYTLNFGDGTILTDVAVPGSGDILVQHTYSVDGSYDVTFSVSDGTTTALSAPFEVAAGDVNDAPVIVNEDSDLDDVDPGTQVTFSADVSDADGDPLTYTWHFGDGNSESGTVPANGVVEATYVYPSEGNFDAFLEVSDGEETVFSTNVPVLVGDPVEVPVTSGLVLLLQSDIKIGLGAGTTVAAWLDGSGNGNNLFAQGDPQLLEAQTPTGQPAIVFDGVGDLLQRIDANDTIFNLPAGNADRTIFLVVDYVDPEGTFSGAAYGDAAANEAFGLVADSSGELTVQGFGASNDFGSGVNGVNGGFMVQAVTLSGGTLSHYQDGTLIDSSTHVFNTDVQQLILGADIGNTGEAQLSLGAVLIYDRALNASEMTQVQDFLTAKYIGAPTTPPVAQDDLFSVNEDAVLNGDVLADNGNGVDSDPDGDPLSVNTTPVDDVDNGTLALNADGTFTYTPNADFNGVDSFTYTVLDGSGGSDTGVVTITVDPLADPPAAQNDNFIVAEDTQLAGDVLADNGNGVDSDPDGDPLSVNTTLVDDVDNGTLVLNADGTFTYDPNSGFVGTDTFIYEISDGNGGTDQATVSIDVGGSGLVTAGLVGHYEADANVSLGAGSTVVGWLDGSGLGNDLLAQGDPQIVNGATPTGQSAIVFDGMDDLLERVNEANTLTGFADGSGDRTLFFLVNYVDHEGITAGLIYGDDARNEAFGVVSDWNGGDLAVQGYGRRNDFDSGVDAASQGWIVQSVVLDSDTYTHYLNGTAIDSGTHTFNTDLQRLLIGAEIGNQGEASLEVGAALIYNRALSETERQDVETYLQSKYITGAPTTPPVAQDDLFSVNEDAVLNGDVLADNGNGVDSDPDGDPLSVNTTPIDDVDNGTLALNADGTFTYTPNPGFFGADEFIYEISDGVGGSDQGLVSITVDENTFVA